ncbi:MAG: TetR/AcrR family transcriptional regulator [Lachnospiraceae bacterium]|nr:TetR/AcrR family transcriptional regulator [Lachnospiraceae bacterium]
MARNKHPEETVNRILEVSLRLFLEKGYEYTSIRDIIDGLGNLSKGAIYHHFKSKEDILEAVTDKLVGSSNRMLTKIRDRKDLNGREKLKTIFRESLMRPGQEELFAVAPDIGKNPKLLFSILRDTTDVVAPRYILPIIEEGIRDGSIETDYPAELAELVILVANVWMNPMVFEDSTETSKRKFMLFAQMMQGFGLDVVDDEMLARLECLTEIYQKNK